MTAPAAVVSGDCPHEDWTATATMIRDRDEDDGPIIAWAVELTMTCVGCGAPMLWHGVRAGDDAVWAERSARPKGLHQTIQPLTCPDRVTIFIPCAPHPPGERS